MDEAQLKADLEAARATLRQAWQAGESAETYKREKEAV